MGNREALLAGAKRCLQERGYARTTARDVAAAAGVSLAAIGYHFGSMDTLLNLALIEAIGDWGDALERALAGEGEPDADPLARFEATWTRVIASFAAHRTLWAASFEAAAQAEHLPQVRQILGDAFQQGRTGLAELFQGLTEADDPQAVRAVGSFHQALLTGVLAQWLIDPDRAPSGRELADGLRLIAAGVSAPHS